MPWLQKMSDKFLQLTRGRTTAFFLMFFVSGHAMALLGKLNSEYIAFMGTLGGLVLLHSTQENYIGTKAAPPPAGGA